MTAKSAFTCGDPGSISTLPLNVGTAGRFLPDAVAVVCRSHEGGKAGQAVACGRPAIVTVAMSEHA
ncbi:MAG: hypothetical protein R3F54_27525 [Alphaproteobacteria bacterium]